MSKLFLSLMVGLLSLLSTSVIQAQETRVAIFDPQRVMRESNPAKQAEAKIEQEFSKRNKELLDMAGKIKLLAEKLDKDASVISDSDRIKRQRELTELDQEFKRKQRIFNEDVSQRKNEEISAIGDRTYKIVKQIAEAEKYDVVLQDAVYYNPRIDITDKVLKALAK
ncbi:MAG: OmpH family outer membrane protein [Burkholderiaceae bacterium]|nr:OmpH family outer membrane protein [Burkholderiaceae bacterium]